MIQCRTTLSIDDIHLVPLVDYLLFVRTVYLHYSRRHLAVSCFVLLIGFCSSGFSLSTTCLIISATSDMIRLPFELSNCALYAYILVLFGQTLFYPVGCPSHIVIFIPLVIFSLLTTGLYLPIHLHQTYYIYTPSCPLSPILSRSFAFRCRMTTLLHSFASQPPPPCLPALTPVATAPPPLSHPPYTALPIRMHTLLLMPLPTPLPFLQLWYTRHGCVTT